MSARGRRRAWHVTALASALFATLLVPTVPAAHATPVRPEKAQRKVVLFAFDGLDADYLGGRVPLPNIEGLARRGSLSTGTGVMPSVTNPSWTSVATGAWPDRHLNAAYYYDPAANIVRGPSRASGVPGLGEALREQGRTLAAVQWFVLENKGVAYGDPQGLYTQPGGDCDRRTDDAVAVIERQPVASGGQPVVVPDVPDLLALYCDDLDVAGHETGDSSVQVSDALRRLDAQVGRVVEAARQSGTYEDTTFVMLGDHGMTSYDAVNGQQTLAAVEAAGYHAEWVGTGRSPHVDTEVVLTGAGLTSLHLRGRAASDPLAAARIREALLRVEGIDRVIDKTEQARLRMPPVYGDLVVEPAPGWAMFSGDVAHTRGRHGTRDERGVAFLLSGSGVRAGTPPSGPRHVDVAPTIAYLLRARPPAAAQGRVLTEALLSPRV